MGVLSNKIGTDELKPGDHIYSWRSAYIFAHHGIYVGDDKVIHFTRAAGQETGTGTVLDKLIFSSSPSNPRHTCEKCGDQTRLHGVIISCLDCFLAEGNLYLFCYSVTPAFFISKARGGTCTLAASDPPDAVLHRARYLLENNGFGMYSIFKNNCEDFAMYCKTGLLVETSFSVGSGQISSLTAAITAVASSPLRFLTASFPGLILVTGSMYCIGRYVSDIGIRRDVDRVPVEVLFARMQASGSEAQTSVVSTN